MPLTKRIVDAPLTGDLSKAAIAAQQLPAEWCTGTATLLADTAAVTIAADATEAHVITTVYASLDVAGIGILTIFDGTAARRFSVHNQATVPVNFRAAANKTVAASLGSAGASVYGYVSMDGYSVKI